MRHGLLGPAYATGPYYNILAQMSLTGRPKAVKACFEYAQRRRNYPF